MSELRHWYKFDDANLTCLMLTTAVKGARDLLEQGKVEDAKTLLDFAIKEVDRSKIGTTESMTPPAPKT